jgi:hypothetical protein
MRGMTLLVLLLSVAALLAFDVQREMAVQDSLRQVPPKWRAGWLRSRGLDDSYYSRYRVPEGSGLRLVGKYGRGPAVEVTGRDSLVFVALGSEVAVVNVANPDQPRVLSEIQVSFRPGQVAVWDSLLLIGGNGIEVWNVAAPDNPQFISRIPYAVGDFCIRDSLVFAASLDTFMVYSIANPVSPQRLGAYPDSGYVTSYTGNTVVIVLSGGLGFVDVSNPASPHRVGSYASYAYSACALRGLCCVTQGSPSQPAWLQLRVLDISNPASIIPLGSLDSAGGYDLYMSDSLVFASGYYTGGHEFQVIGLGDSTHPTRVGGCTTPGDGWAVWVNRPAGRAYLADPDYGLALLDVSNLAAPTLDTAILRADMAMDVAVQGNLALVADYTGGLKVLDISSPTSPTEIGHLDTVSMSFTSTSVAVRDSFAFASWWPQPYFRSLDVADPSSPQVAGGCNVFDQPGDIVVRDTLAYLAVRLRFQVVSVAQPRAPVLVGSCVTGDATSAGLWLTDTLAYVANDVTQVINVANPVSPSVVGQFGRGAWNVTVRDTFAFLSSGGILVYSVADPRQPRLIDSLSVGPNTAWVEAVGTLLYTGNRDGVRVVDAFDVHNMRVRGFCATPYSVDRLTFASPYIYAACWDAGVCVAETTAVGLAEETRQVPPRMALSVCPNPAGTTCVLTSSSGLGVIVVRDIAGRRVASIPVEKTGERRARLNLSGLKSGVYFVEAQDGGRTVINKLIRR